MTILVAAGFDTAEWAAWWPLLVAALPGERLLRDRADVREIDVAIVANPPPGSLAGLPNLRLIQSLWAGVDRLLDDPTVPRDVPLARMVDPAMNEAMAQTALWVVAGLQRDFLVYGRQQRSREWRQLPYRRADEVAVAVLGHGQMGQACARRLVDAGYPVTGWRRGDGTSLASVLAGADVVINLLPLTPDTRGLFDRVAFAAMKPGAAFVNLARGAHVVDADLLAALDRGQVGHAVLDVFATEPLPPDHPYWAHRDDVTVLPHVAAPTDPRSAAVIAADNIRALRAAKPLRHLVDRTKGY